MSRSEELRIAQGAMPLEGRAARLPGAVRLVPWLLPVLLVAGWEIVARLELVPARIFPPPSEVLEELEDLAASGKLAQHMWISLVRVWLGFLLGSAAATVLGGLAGYVAVCRHLWDGLLQALRAVPVIAWVPLFILWIGIGEGSKIALIAIGAFFPVYVNVMAGLLAVDRKLVEVGRANRLSGLRLALKIYLPASLPSYLLGLRIGMGLSWMFVAAAELIGASEGVGYLLVYGQNMGRPALILASIILFAVAGKITDLLFAWLSYRLLAWQDTVVDQRT